MLNEHADGVSIAFGPIEELDDSVYEMLIHSETVKALLDDLGASLTVDKAKEELNLEFPNHRGL